jgi:hypothetical protein
MSDGANWKTMKSTLAAICALLWLASAVRADSFLLGGVHRSLYDYQIGQSEVQNSRTISPIADPAAGIPFDFDPDGNLYGLASRFSTHAPFYAIDPTTGAAIQIGETIFGERVLSSDISFDPTSGLMYGVVHDLSTNGKLLFHLDIATGIHTILGTFAIGTGEMLRSVAFDNEGDLWVIGYHAADSIQKPFLLSVDKMNADILSTRPIGIEFPAYYGNFWTGADFNAATNTLYLAAGQALYTVDTATGVTTNVKPILGEFNSIAWVPIPEPASLVLSVQAAIVLICRRKNRSC